MLTRRGPFVFSFAFLFGREICGKTLRQRIVPLRWFELFSWWGINYHKVVIEYGVWGLLPVWRKKWYYCRASIIFIILILERHLDIFSSNLFLRFSIELVIQLIDLVQILYLNFFICLFLSENSVNYWSLRATLDFDVALRVDVVTFNVQSRVYYNRCFLLFLLVLGDQFMTHLFITRSRLVVFVHVCIIDKLSCFFVSSK
jgi:hypothetical protein